jgi:uncharacterized protein (DUF1499 family)
MDFATLHRPLAPNTALFADSGDTPSRADRPAPRFAVGPDAVIAAWDGLVRAEPRTVVESFDVTCRRHHAVQRSRIFRFPDDVYAEARADGAGTRLLLYSAARWGKGDLGVNRRRLERWLAQLEAALG